MFKRIATIQLLSGGAFLSTFTYIAIMGDEMGFSSTQVAIMASLFAVCQFFSSYIFGRLADRYGKRRILIIGMLFLSIFILMTTLGTEVYSLWFLRALSGVGFGMYPGALAAYAFETKAKMGRFSAFQSMGWGLSLLISGPVADLFGVNAIFYMASMFVAGAFIVALTLGPIPEVRIRTPLLPMKMIFKNRKVIIPMIIRHSTANSIWVLWPIFLKDEIGLSFIQIGIVQATNALTQFVSMFFIGDRLGPSKAIGLGLLLTSMSALSFILIGSFPLFLITQILLGLSWANLYVGSLRTMMYRNRERATAAGLLTSSTSLSGLIGPFMALALVQILPGSPYTGPMLLTAGASFAAFIYFTSFGMEKARTSLDIEVSQ